MGFCQRYEVFGKGVGVSADSSVSVTVALHTLDINDDSHDFPFVCFIGSYGVSRSIFKTLLVFSSQVRNGMAPEEGCRWLRYSSSQC